MTRPAQAENLLRAGYLLEEAHSAEELQKHLQLAREFMQAATTSALSITIRFLAAYDAVYQVAEAAFRRMDLRVRDRAGGRAMAIQALAWSLDAPKALMPILIQANNRRGAAIYSPLDASVSEKELAELVAAAHAVMKIAGNAFKPRGAPVEPKPPASGAKRRR